MFDPTHVPKAAAKEGAGRVFDHTWVGSREALGAADHRASPMGRSPDPRFQTPPEHRPVDLGKILPEAGLVRFRAVRRSARAGTTTAGSRPADSRVAAGHPRGGPCEPERVAVRHRRPGHAGSPPEHPGPEPARDEFDVADPFALRDPAPAPVAPPPAPVAAPSAPPVQALPPEPPAIRQADPPPQPSVAPPPPAAEPATAPVVPDMRLIEAFLEGAGLGAHTVPIDDPDAFMREAGARLRELTEGLVQLLNARASLKNVARIERTTIGRDLNNPLKYSIAPGEALLAVLIGRGPGFLPPEAAVRGGFRDIQEHEMALLDAMQIALRALLRRFEPASFEQQLEAENLFSTLIGGGRRAKCWDAFKARYERIASEAEREFLGEVGADFTRGYEARTRRM